MPPCERGKAGHVLSRSKTALAPCWCSKVRIPYAFREFSVMRLTFNFLGRYDGINYNRRVHVKRSKITGKAMVCGKIMTEWRKEWIGGSKKDY